MARNHQGAFTKVELLVVLVVIGVVFLVMHQNRFQRYKLLRKANCIVHMKHIGLSFRMFATDHGDLFPMQVGTNDGGVKEFMGDSKKLFRVFQSLSNELSRPLELVCPNDIRKPSFHFPTLQNSNISYFVGLDAKEANKSMILAGDHNLQSSVAKDKSGILNLGTNVSVTWSRDMHRDYGTLVLADGSVQPVGNLGLRDLLQQTGVATNRFMLPD